MYVYGGDKFKLSTFYKKRFFGIYPMFWIAYFFGFLLLFWIYKQIPFQSVPKWKFIFTIIGCDGMISSSTSTFYILGEWFLGCIICLYIVFPLMRFLINKYPKISVFLILTAFCAMELFYNWRLPRDVIFITRLPEFCFGMYFIKYIKKVKWPFAIAGLIIIIVNWIIAPDFIPQDVQILYIGVASFIILMYISKFIEKSKLIVDLSGFISKYSYAIFLTHHVIIMQVCAQFNIMGFSIWSSIACFTLCLVLTLISSVLLYKFEKTIMSKIFTYLATKKTN